MKFLEKLLQILLKLMAGGTTETFDETQGARKIKNFDHIKEWEGLELQAYQDIVGVWTIGYGHTKTARPGMTITQAEADWLLAQDVAWVNDAINKHVTVPLNQNQFDAIGSFVYNLGESAFARSTLLKRINEGRFQEAADEFLRWDKARVDGKLQSVRGLARRRQDERRLFLTT